MNTSDIGRAVREKLGLTQAGSEQAIFLIFSTIGEALKEGKTVHVHNFGNFKSVARKARNGVNPTTRQPISIPASKGVHLTVASALKKFVNGGEPLYKEIGPFSRARVGADEKAEAPKAEKAPKAPKAAKAPKADSKAPSAPPPPPPPPAN